MTSVSYKLLSTVTPIQASDPPSVRKQKADYLEKIEQVLSQCEDSHLYPKQGYASDSIIQRGITDDEAAELDYQLEKAKDRSINKLVARMKEYERENDLPPKYLLNNDLETIKRLAGLI